MKYTMVRLNDHNTYEDCMEAIELIENNPDNVVGGAKAFNSGYQTKLLKGAQAKIDALQKRADKLVPEDEYYEYETEGVVEAEDVAVTAEEITIPTDTPSDTLSRTAATTEQQQEISMANRTYAYCRVSTTEQTTENQILAIRNAGYSVQDNRVVQETVSGSVCAMERPEFKSLVEHKLEAGDTLVALKLDRLGRDSIDVQKTVEMLMSKGINVVCLDLPVPNLSSAEGKLMLQMFMAFAEFERNRIRERTIEGQVRARSEGKTIGRPEATATREKVQQCKAEGLSQSKTAKYLGMSVAGVKYHWNVTAEDKQQVETTKANAQDEYHRIIEVITGNNGLSVRAAAKELGVSTGKVQRAKAKHVKELEDAGVDVKTQYPNSK